MSEYQEDRERRDHFRSVRVQHAKDELIDNDRIKDKETYYKLNSVYSIKELRKFCSDNRINMQGLDFARRKKKIERT